MKAAFVTLVLTATVLVAQQRDSSSLTVERIHSAEFRSEGVGQTQWLDDSTYTRLARTSTGAGFDIVRVNAATGATSVLVSAASLTPAGQKEPLDVEEYTWSDDHTKLLIFTNSARVWRANTRGDFWVLDTRTNRVRKLGGRAAKPSTLMFAKFSPDGGRVAYVRENNLYVESLRDGTIVPLTRDGSVTTINGTFDWVYEEELDDRDGFRWSPDGTRIAYWQLDARGVRDFLLINDTDSLYSYTIPIQYPKAGTTNSAARVGVVSARGGRTTWMKIPGDPRNNYIARMDWAANADQLAVQQLNRRQTTNTVYLVDAATGVPRVLFVERDSAWIDVFGDPTPSLIWTTDGSQFVWLSERDGLRHAYLVARDGTTHLITRGEYDVVRVAQIDTRAGWLYYYASPENATQMFLYRIRLDGSGAPQRLTPASAGGWHRYDIGPNARYALHSYSSWGVPQVTELVRLPSHETVRTLAANTRLKEKLATLAQGRNTFFQVDIGDGVKLDAWMMRPPTFDSTKKYPVLFTVYGEPAGQTVVDRYGGAGWLWHLMLTQQGYIVASVDNRGTPSPRGRAWRKAALKQLGGIRVREQAAAVRAIGAQMPYVDTARIGVWGWSGGGTSTLLLMFRAPDLYKVGMSVAPVPNARNYDTIYEERYVGLPSTDSAAYYDASPINYVSGLRGDLLVVHGSGDDNVHYQGTEQLVNALVAHNKPFTMMVYPNRTHGIFEGPGTTVHLYNLLTRFLTEHLPAGLRTEDARTVKAPAVSPR